MPYESYDPSSYLFLLVISAALAIIKYCAFPLIFANFRTSTISKKKYYLFCWGFNLIVWILTTAIFYAPGERVSSGAFFLWTAVFSGVGASRLAKKGVFPPEEKKVMCPRCGHRMKPDCKFCGKCGQKMPEPEPEAETEEQPAEQSEGLK